MKWIVTTFAAIAVLVVGVACAQATATPEPGPSELMRVLERTSASFKEAGIVFMDLGRSLDLAGVSSLQECAEGEPGQKACIEALTGMPLYVGVLNKSSTRPSEWEQAFGFNHYDASLAMGTGKYVISTLPDSASYLEGQFDQAIIRQKLLDLGYEEKHVAGYTYHSIRDDFRFDVNDPVSRMALGTMNRVYVGDGILVSAPTTVQMEAFLETWARDRPSLKADAACSSLAEALGNVLAAALMTRDAVWEPAQDELSTYEKPPDWGGLHQWEAFAAGYGRTSDAERWYRFSVYCDDPEAADADAKEMVKRMRTYTMVDGGMKPFDLECSSLTSQVREEANGSTLTVQCDLREDKGQLWLMLVEMRELMFLVP